MKKFIYLCGMLFLSMNMMAQQKNTIQAKDSNYCYGWKEKRLNVPYRMDTIPHTPGWRYDSVYSDEFNGTSINTYKWEVKDTMWHASNTHVGYVNFHDNVHVENGKLYLTVRNNDNNVLCHCSWNTTGPHSIIPELLSGWIQSNKKVQYGYFETKCYLPRNHNYWPCFWLYKRDESISDYDEVDVFERTSGEGTNQPNKLRQNCYNKVDYPDYSKISQILTFPDSITGRSSIFGVEVLPKEVVFYINGHVTSHLVFNEDADKFNYWNTLTCTDIEEMIPMRMLLTLTCDPTQTALPLPYESAWFDYARCYKLERDSIIDTYHPSVFTPSDISTRVYPHIILGGTGYTANISTSTALWAEQDIILDKGFELSEGTAFSARVISVPNATESPLYIQNCPH